MRTPFPRFTGIFTVSPTKAQVKLPSPLFLVAALLTMLCGGAQRGWAAASTSTSLAITSNGAVVSSVSQGTVVTLTATVKAGGSAVTAGLVNFCDAAATNCSDIHLLGFADLTSSGIAAYTFVPGAGIHSYRAEYAGTSGSAGYAASSSAASSLTVDNVPTTTTITQSGSAGAYTLNATVVGTGSGTGPTGAVSFLDASNQNAVLGTATLGTAASAFTWTTQSPATAPEPNSIAVADFNGDGIPDIAIATNGTTGTSGIGSIQILLGNGDGTFQAAKTYAGLSGNQLIVAAPFITGGPEDLLVVNNATSANNGGTANNGLLFTGDGKGNFQAGTPFRTGLDSITAIVTGDLNGDGIQDYVLAGTVFGTSVFGDTFGNGTGTFGLVTLNAINSLPITVVALGIGDFNGDGALDLAIIESDGEVQIFQNNTQGYFFPGSTPPSVGASPTAIAVGDFNGDGNADLAITNGTQDNVTILLGNGAGVFTAAASPPTGATPTAIAVGDFNGDGVPDLAVANSGDGTVTILQGKGDGTFTAMPPLNTGNTPVSLAVGAFNGAKTSDIAVANQASASTLGSTATVLLSQLTQTATATATSISPIGSGAHLVAASYPGDANYAASVSGTTSLNAQSVSTAIALTPNPTSSAFGQQVLLTATLNPYSAGSESTNGETVTFYSGGNSIGTGTLTSGVATLNTTSLPAGSDSLTAKFAGDTSFNTSTSPAVAFTVTSSGVSLSSNTLTFASQLTGTTSTAQTVTLTNSGTAALTMASIAASAPFAETNTCGGSVASGANCAISVTFAPTAAGSPTGTLTITDNASGSPQTVSLSGTAISPTPAVTLSGTSLTFATQTIGSTSAALTVMLTNSGTGALAITSITASGDFTATNNCSSSVATGANCTISVTFTPTASGTRTGAVTITDNAAGSPQAIALTGTGIAPVIAATLSSTSLTFAAQATGSTSAAQTVMLTNTGTGVLAISSIAASANFGETNTCGSSLAAGGNCTISVTFTPTAAGSLAGTVTVTDNTSSSPQTVALAGTGTSVGVVPTTGSLSIPSPGGSATDTIQITSAGGFSGTVNLTCTVTYQGTATPTDLPTCSLNPQQGQVTAGSPLSSTLTVSTTGTGSQARSNGAWLPSGTALAALFFIGFLPRRRGKNTMLFVLLAMTLGCAATGCGGSSQEQTTTGSYQVVVKATSATVTASTTIALALQ